MYYCTNFIDKGSAAPKLFPFKHEQGLQAYSQWFLELHETDKREWNCRTSDLARGTIAGPEVCTVGVRIKAVHVSDVHIHGV